MGTVTRTELNQQTAKVLARVAAGERLIVTDRGVPVAEIAPPPRSTWDALIAAGRVRPARREGAADLEPELSGPSVSEMIDDVRRDRA